MTRGPALAWYRGLGSALVLAVPLLLLSSMVQPEWAAVLLAVLGVGFGTALRRVSLPGLRDLALLPPVVVVGLFSIAVPATNGNELLAGLSAVFLVAWLADDPLRQPRGVLRALPTLMVLALALAVAWGSGSILPAGGVPLGVGVVLLLALVALVSLLLGRPDLLGAEGAASS